MRSNVEKWMKLRGYNVPKIADKTNLSEDVIRKAKNHIEFSTIRSLQKIAVVLGCRVKDLFDEEE